VCRAFGWLSMLALLGCAVPVSVWPRDGPLPYPWARHRKRQQAGIGSRHGDQRPFVGMCITDRPGLKFALGYAASQVVSVADGGGGRARRGQAPTWWTDHCRGAESTTERATIGEEERCAELQGAFFLLGPLSMAFSQSGCAAGMPSWRLREPALGWRSRRIQRIKFRTQSSATSSGSGASSNKQGCRRASWDLWSWSRR